MVYLDIAVMLDCQRGKRNLSMGCIDVHKAYASVDHDWLCDLSEVHRLPVWLGEVIRKLCGSWNTTLLVFMTSSVAQGRQLLRKELKQAAPYACLPQSIGKANMATKATSPLEQNLPRFHSEQQKRQKNCAESVI